jgi:hypothetical protein
MTWTGIDSARLADDEAAAALGVRIREDLADTAPDPHRVRLSSVGHYSELPRAVLDAFG